MNLRISISVVALALSLSACGGSDTPPFTCTIGSLRGSWQTHYTESNGTCGPISDETTVFGSSGGNSSCTGVSANVSPDHCSIDTTSTCPLSSTTISGTQSWTVHFTQSSPTELDGTGTVQVVSSAGSCRSTYSMTLKKL